MTLSINTYTQACFNSVSINRKRQFLAATIDAQGMISEDRIAVAFDKLDADDTGYITVKNLMDFMGKDSSQEAAIDIVRETTGCSGADGRISYQQFLAAIRLPVRNEAREVFDPSESPSDASEEHLSINADITGRSHE